MISITFRASAPRLGASPLPSVRNYVANRAHGDRRGDEQVWKLGCQGDKTTSVWLARKSFSIGLMGHDSVLSYMGNGTIYLVAYENWRPCAVAQATRP
jgi:hypothetical protein